VSETDEPPRPAGNPWRTRLPILTLAHVVGTLHITTLVVMAPVIKADLSLSFAQFGLLVTAYSIGQITGSLPAGHLADRVGVGWALVLAHALLIVGAVMLTQATGLWLGFAAMVVTGWGYSVVNPATAKGVFETFPPARRGTAMGIKQTGVPLGGVISASLGAFARPGAWHWITVTVAAITLVGGAICLLIVEKPRPRPATASRSRFGTLGEVAKDFNFGRFVLSNMLHNLGQQNFFSYLTLFLREAAQTSQEFAGLCYGIAQAASVVGRLGWGTISDFLFKGRRKKLTVAIGASAAVLLATMAAIEPRAGMILAVALSGLLGLTIASYAPLMQTMAVEAVAPRLAGSATGYTLVGTYVGSISGPPLFGWVVDVTGLFDSGWYLCAGLVAIGVVVLAFGFRERGL
jgi:ACS family hexuronate transporter-like MFS transporter